MKKLLLLAIIVMATSCTFAEDRYEAWYINKSKDTVFGHIIVQHPDSLSFSVLFESKDGTINKLEPHQIKRFGFIMLESWKIYTVLDLGEPTRLKDSSTLLFAQVLNEEEHVKYYRYKYYHNKPGRYNNDMYVQGERLLTTEHCLMKKGEVLRFQTNSLFTDAKKKLRSFFEDCDLASNSLKQVKNLSEQLPLIVKQYNRCHTKK